MEVVLIGRPTTDIELKSTESGKYYVSFSLARSRRFNKSVTDFFEIVAWEKNAELASKFLSKGKQVAIFGELQNSQYTDKSGLKRTKTQIVVDYFRFLDNKDEGAAPRGYSSTTAFSGIDESGYEDITDNGELPF